MVISSHRCQGKRCKKPSVCLKKQVVQYAIDKVLKYKPWGNNKGDPISEIYCPILYGARQT